MKGDDYDYQRRCNENGSQGHKSEKELKVQFTEHLIKIPIFTS